MNQVIEPTLYCTPKLLALFLCPGCANASCNHEMVTEMETKMKTLVEDNGVNWPALLTNLNPLPGSSGGI